MKALKKSLLAFVAISIINVTTNIKTYPHIPLKGLFEVLKIDDIGFAHSLLHSKWIENFYQYAEGKPPSKETKWEFVPDDDSVANLVRTFWFRRLEQDQLLPSKLGVLDFLTPKVFGKLINLIYLKTETKGYKELIEEWRDLYVGEIKKISANLKSLEIKQEERAKLLDQRKKLDKELKSATKHHRQALANKEKKLASYWETVKEYRSKPEEKKKEKLEVKVKRARKKLAKSMVKIQKLRKQKKSKNLKLKQLKEKLGLAKDNKKKIEDAKWVLRKIGGYLDIKKKLENQSQEEIVTNTAAPVENKIKQIIGLIQKSINFCARDNVYVTRTTEAILWALFFHKLDRLRSREEKIKAINDCIRLIDKRLKSEDFQDDTKLEDLYGPQNFAAFEKNIKDLAAGEQIDKIFQNYDLALHFLINILKSVQFPPVVSQGSYGYEYEKGKISKSRPNCYETAMHDLFSILWYNPAKATYDNSLFAKNVITNGKGFKRFRDALKYFYLADQKGVKSEEYTVNKKFPSLLKLQGLGKIKPEEVENLSIAEVPAYYINRSVMKQEFMNIVSGIPKITYHWQVTGKGKIFELTPGVKNFVNLLNYFYGIEVDNVADLGNKNVGISTDSRSIEFKKGSGADAPNEIEIRVSDRANYAYFNITVNIQVGHVFLSVPGREQPASKILKKGVAKSLIGGLLKKKEGEEEEQEGEMESEDEMVDKLRNITILTLLTSEQLLKDKDLVWNLPILNLVYYSLIIKRPEVKLALIEDVLARRPQYYDSVKGMIHNLIEKFPLDDDFLKGRLNKIIMVSKIDDLKDLIKKDTTNEKLLYDVIKYSYNEQEALRVYNDLKQKIKDINQESIIVQAIDQGYKKIVDLIRQRKEFDIAKNSKLLEANVLGKILSKKDKFYLDIALEIVKNPQFDAGQNRIESPLVVALKSGYQDIALKIVKNHKFDAKYVENSFTIALEKEYQDIALTIVNGPKFNAGQYGIVDDLELALKKEYQDIALTLVSNPEFNAGHYAMGDVLKLVLKKGDKDKVYLDIALKIVANPRFDANQPCVEDILKYARDLSGQKPKRKEKLEEIVRIIEAKQKKK